MKSLIIAVAMSAVTSAAHAQTPITHCQTITKAGNYAWPHFLKTPAAHTGACIDITVPGVSLYAPAPSEILCNGNDTALRIEANVGGYISAADTAVLLKHCRNGIVVLPQDTAPDALSLNFNFSAGLFIQGGPSCAHGILITDMHNVILSAGLPPNGGGIAGSCPNGSLIQIGADDWTIFSGVIEGD